jgi:hypothetical protein
MMSGSGGEGNHAEMVGHMQEWVREGMNMDEMTHHMMEGGWMGTAAVGCRNWALASAPIHRSNRHPTKPGAAATP